MAFEMEETRVKIFIYVKTNLGVFAKTRNRTKDEIKNRTNNGIKWNNHRRRYREHILLYFLFQRV
jgi:hypothetical protein